jgi:TIR domain
VYSNLVRQGAANYDVFVSYSRSDAAAAETLRARLHDAGLNTFLDRYGLPAGQPWQPWLEQHLGTCGALVALIGPLGIGEWQHREIQLGLDRQASAAKERISFPVIPVLLPGLANDAVPVGRFLNLNTWADLRNGLDEPESLQRLIVGAQGQAIDNAAAEKLLAGLRRIGACCRSVSKTRACSLAGGGSSRSCSKRSGSARRATWSRSLAVRAAASPQSSTPASSRRCGVSVASVTNLCGKFFTCVLTPSRSTNWRSPLTRRRPSQAR